MNTTTFSKEQLEQLQLVLSQALKPIHQKRDEHTKILDKHSSILDKHTNILDAHTKLHSEHSKKLGKLEKTAALHTKKFAVLEGISKNVLFKVTKVKVQLDILEQAQANKRIAVCEELLGLTRA